MTLILLRHAKSAWDDPGMDDVDRPLNGRGRRAATRLAAHLATRPVPDLILCSPARRTRETIEPITSALPDAPPVRFERDLYLASVETLQARLRAIPDRYGRVLMVGHNPGLHELAVMLAGAGDRSLRASLADKLPTGGLVTLAIDAPWSKTVAGAGRLVSFETPRDLGVE